MTLVLAIAVTSIAGSISPASAAFSDDPDTTWMTNGIVYSVATGGDRVYLGGKFKSLRRCPTGVTCPDGTIKTVNVGALNATTGEGCGRSRSPSPATAPSSMPSPSWTASCTSVASSRRSTGASDEPRRRRRHDGALVTDFSPEVGSTTDDYVRGMLAHDGMLYIAGKFKTVDAFTRQRLAAFNGAGALSGTWRPRTSGLARSFATTCDGSQIIVGGSFEKAAGTGASFQDRKLAAIFDKTTGALDPWATVEHLVGDVGLRPRRHL